jgi:hypothetical protein
MGGKPSAATVERALGRAREFIGPYRAWVEDYL